VAKVPANTVMTKPFQLAPEALAEANGGQALRMLIHMDDPDHKAFRGVASSWFLPGRIRTLEGRVRVRSGRRILVPAIPSGRENTVGSWRGRHAALGGGL
jgi:hypothetical protein